MRIVLVFVFALHSCFDLFAQNIDSSAQYKIYLYLKDSTSNRISFHGGNAGNQISYNIFGIEELIICKRFDLISDLMKSKTASTRYLATAAIKMAVKKKMYVLDSSEKAIIDSLKKDVEEIHYLSGCFGMTIMVSHLSNSKKSDFK